MQQVGLRGDAPARDVKRCAVIHTGAQKGQSNGHIHRAIEAKQLYRDQALIVIHREHHIELTGAGAHEHRVRWQRVSHQNALRTSLGDCGNEHALLIVTEHAAFSRMGIDASDGDAWV